jgi:hypothetical protein
VAKALLCSRDQHPGHAGGDSLLSARQAERSSPSPAATVSPVAPGGGEQQHPGVLPVVAFLTVGFAVSVDVLLTEQSDTRQLIFSASSTMIPDGPRT